MNMSGCPAPNFNFLFSFPISSFASPIPATLPPTKPDRTPSIISPISIDPDDESSSRTVTPRSAAYALSLPHSPLDILPAPVRSMSISHPGTTPTLSRRRENIIPTHYLECCKCKKKRAVPMYRPLPALSHSTLDESMLPNFECSMNIWDTQYNHCSIPENNAPNYTLSFAGHTPQYAREQSEFMYRLKLFIKNRNVGSFKQPMLGKREVDLYRLFREVTAHGGCENVVKKEGTWSRIYRGMDNYSPTETSASYRLKKMWVCTDRVSCRYTKYLLDFEKEMFNFRCSTLPRLPDYTLPRADKHSAPTTPLPYPYVHSPMPPSSQSSMQPSMQPSMPPSMPPSSHSSMQPSMQPSVQPSMQPSMPPSVRIRI